MEVTLKFLSLISLGVLTACASATSKEESDSCQFATRRLSAIKIDRDMLRDQKKSDADVRRSLERGGFSLNDDQIKGLRGFVHKACGALNNGLAGSLKDWGDERHGNEFDNAATSESMQILEEQYKKNTRAKSSISMQNEVSKVDINAVFTDEEKYQYPSFSGEMKSDAQAKRKAFFQEKVMNKLVSTGVLLAAFHTKIQDLLRTKVMMPLSGVQAKDAEAHIAHTLSDYEIDDETRDKVLLAIEKSFNSNGLRSEAIVSERKTPSMTKGTSQDLRQASYDEKDAIADFFKDLCEMYPYTYASAQELDDGEHNMQSKEDMLKKLVKSRALRTKMMAALIMSETKISAQRLNDKEFVISIRTDFPVLFRKYPLTDMSKFVER